MSKTKSDNDPAARLNRCDIWNKRTVSASPVLGARNQSKSPVNTKRVLRERRCQSISAPRATVTNVERIKLTPDMPPAQEKIPKIPNFSDSQDPVLPYHIVTRVHRTLVAKKRELIKLRKNMIAAQNVVLEAYAHVRDLESRAGCEMEESVGEVRVISVTGWPSHDILLLIRSDFDTFAHTDVGGNFGPQVLQQLQSQLYSIPDEINGLGSDLIMRTNELLNLFHSRQRGERTYGKGFNVKVTNTFSVETETMRNLVATSVQNLKAKLSFVMKLAKMPWLDRDILIKKLEKLSKENLILQTKVDELKKEGLENQEPNKNEAPYQTVVEELARERAAREALKEVVSDAESMLRVARARISTVERQLKETRAELDTLRRKHKDLEQLYRHRESSYDARSRKLIEVSKTGEITIETLARQRDAFELRVKELREQGEAMQKVAEKQEAIQRSTIDSLQTKVAEQEKYLVAAEAKSAKLEIQLKDLDEKFVALREQSVKLVDVEKQRGLEYVPTKENEPTDGETELWKELQKTRTLLAKTEEELKQSRADKDSFLKSISKIAQDGGENAGDTLAAELVEKEKKIFELEHVIEDFKENEKNMENGMIHYENQLASLRMEVHRLRNYDCYVKDLPNQDIETELTELHIQVETLCRERSALLTAAASRALMLERHERAADLFAKITRARRELDAHLNEGFEPPILEQSKIAEVTCSLSSVYTNAAETWTALRAERARVLRLESAVVAQGWQLQREGRVRTQLESRRADLERRLLTINENKPQISFYGCDNHESYMKRY